MSWFCCQGPWLLAAAVRLARGTSPRKTSELGSSDWPNPTVLHDFSGSWNWPKTRKKGGEKRPYFRNLRRLRAMGTGHSLMLEARARPGSRVRGGGLGYAGVRGVVSGPYRRVYRTSYTHACVTSKKNEAPENPGQQAIRFTSTP